MKKLKEESKTSKKLERLIKFMDSENISISKHINVSKGLILNVDGIEFRYISENNETEEFPPPFEGTFILNE